MKTSVLFIAITIMWTSVFAQMKDNQQLIYEFDKLLASEFKPDEPGAVVLISKKGEVIYKKALGMAHLELNQPMQMDNVFWIASIGKQFTAIAILQLMEQGKLNLQDEVTRFLPDYPTQGTNITIEHLLTHTSGIHNFSGMPDPEKKAVVVHLTTKKLNGIEIWQKTNLPLPDSNGIKVDSKILDTYVGEYEIQSVMRFSVTKVKDRLFIQAEGQDSFGLFAETVHTFFTKVNDAEFEFVKDENGKVIKVILSQGGRKAEAIKRK